MKQIVNVKPLDITPFPKGFLVVIADGQDENGNVKIAFLSYDIKTNALTRTTKSVYLLHKFGPAFKNIVEQVGDYISCAAGILPSQKTHIVYPTGEMGTFDPEGTLIWTGDLLYHGSPIRSMAVDDKFIWCAVPSHNSIIRYSPTLKKVDFRIGGEKSNTFAKPMAVFRADNVLYISNKNSCCVNCVDLDTFYVKNYKEFEEPVLRFLKMDEMEVVVLPSGVYIL